jgi:hypothetical protein
MAIVTECHREREIHQLESIPTQLMLTICP